MMKKNSKFLIVAMLLFFILNSFSYSFPQKTRNNFFDFSLKKSIIDNYIILKGKVSNILKNIGIIITGDLPSKRLGKGD